MKRKTNLTIVEITKTQEDILNGLKGLKEPPWNKMDAKDRLLHACLCAYQKHHCGNEDIRWSELGDILHNAICETVGDDTFVAWNESSGWSEESQ
jgi:hypothetical protein